MGIAILAWLLLIVIGIISIIGKARDHVETVKIEHQLDEIKKKKESDKKANVDGEKNSESSKSKKKIYDEHGFNAKGIHKKTKTLYDELGFDKNGFNAKGINRLTNTKWNKLGFDKNGINKETGTKYSIYHFDINGINEFTGMEYDEDGFNQDGWDCEGYDREGFNKYGHDREGFNREGFNKDGYNKKGYDKDGYDKDWYNEDGYNKSGFNREGYDEDGFDGFGRDKDGHTRERYIPNLELEGKHILFFDTETTGLDDNDQIVQFGGIYGIIRNGEFKEEKIINQYINVTVPIGQKAYETHHISKDFLESYGYFEDYVTEIMGYFHNANLVVGHNVEFDLKMVANNTKRVGIDFSPVYYFDTMKQTTDLVCIPRYDGTYKRPKLPELYYFLFHKGFDNAHDAMADITATKECFIELYKLRYFSWEKVKTYPTPRAKGDYFISDGEYFYVEKERDSYEPLYTKDDLDASGDNDYAEYDNYEPDPDEIIAGGNSQGDYDIYYHTPDYDDYDE